MRSEFHAKVPITTMNITPTSAASGMSSISGEAKRMKLSRNSAATMPAMRVRPPDFTLIIDWPIIAQPAMPPMKPVAVLATPWPMHSWFLSLSVSVRSSTMEAVIRLSSRPTAATPAE